MSNEHSNIVPDVTSPSRISDFKFWCQKVLPLVYDDSLSYYEVLGKMATYLNQVIDNVNQDSDNVDANVVAFLALQDYVNNFFDDIDQLATYAERAETAETSAISYAASAAESATNAASSALNALSAKSAAETAQSSAETAATNASTSATAAAGSATAASSSATNAASSALAASGSATNAATSASAAQTSAGLAETARSNAATQATNAAASATAASGSATAAAGSATEAAASAAGIQESATQIATNAEDIEDLQTEVEHLNNAIQNAETITGEYAYFDSPTDSIPLDNVTVTYPPFQSGSGTPSSENVRPFEAITNEKSLFINNGNLFAMTRSTSTTTIATTIKFFWSGNKLAVYGGSSGNEASSTVTAWKNIGSVYLNPGKYKFYVKVPSHSGTCDNGYFRTYETGGASFSIPLSTWKTITITKPTRLYMSFYIYHCDFGGSSSNPKYFDIAFLPIDSENTTKESVRNNLTLSYAGLDPMYGFTHNITSGKLFVTYGHIASYAGESINEPWLSSIDEYAEGTSPSTGAEVVYPLTEPIEINLDPIDITPMMGINFMELYKGEISVTYGEYTSGLDKKIEINKENITATQGIVAKVLDEMKADTNLSANDFRIVNNILYKITSSISSGGTLTPGTNCTATTVGAEITALLNA